MIGQDAWEGQLRVLQTESQELKAVLIALVAFGLVGRAEAPRAAGEFLAPSRTRKGEVK
eukprot:SAG31_NODE_1046_length_10177_cov_13.677218_12_plen_59_part_00